METTKPGTASAPSTRRFREEGEESADADDARSGEISFRVLLPLEVHMTDEPGGDPYNHSGRFRRNFR
jgi:hypothetical protein